MADCPESTVTPPSTLLLACGALAHEVSALIQVNGWDHMTVKCLPANLHNRPEQIPDKLRAKIRSLRSRFDRIVILYGDCGTGGGIDKVVEEENLTRIDGFHCYEFYSGTAEFTELSNQELGTFYLTDFLVRHFERLVIEGLGLDRHPHLTNVYFKNYRRLVHLAQIENAELKAMGEAAAERLGLDYEYRFTGLGGLEGFLKSTFKKDRKDKAGGHEAA